MPAVDPRGQQRLTGIERLRSILEGPTKGGNPLSGIEAIERVAVGTTPIRITDQPNAFWPCRALPKLDAGEGQIRMRRIPLVPGGTRPFRTARRPPVDGADGDAVGRTPRVVRVRQTDVVRTGASP